MTLDDWITVLPALGPLVVVIGGVIVNIIVAMRTNQKIDANTDLTSELSADTKVIAGHVNSAATAAAGKIDALEKRVEQLVVLLAESKETATRLAQSTASINEAAAHVPPDCP